jgi:hypothetical protein
MNKWKIAFWVCLTVLLLMTAFSVYSIIDQAVTLTYQKEGYTDTENDLDNLIEIINRTDLTKHKFKMNLKTTDFMNIWISKMTPFHLTE